MAFKEWLIVVDALGRGEQILILRKGGIAEGRGGFRPEHEDFLLFPTLFHQQSEAVLPAARERFDRIAPRLPPASSVRLEFRARVTETRRLESIACARRLTGHHIWRDEVIAQRFDRGGEKNIHALLVRVCRLPEPIEMPMRPEYGGCRSWIELAEDVPTDRCRPVLSDRAFEERLKKVRHALNSSGEPVSAV